MRSRAAFVVSQMLVATGIACLLLAIVLVPTAHATDGHFTCGYCSIDCGVVPACTPGAMDTGCTGCVGICDCGRHLFGCDCRLFGL